MKASRRGRPVGLSGQAQVLTPEQIIRVLRLTRTRPRHASRAEAAFCMSLYLGLRAKEIAALKWGGIFDGKDQVRDVLHLKAAYTKGSKTRSSYLAAPKLRQVLKDYGNAYGDWRQPEGALFRSHRGSNMTAGSMVRLLKQIYCEAGLPDTSSHTGRRTFIT